MEKSPWYKNVDGPFPEWEGPTGVKADGGGCTRGQGKVGSMDVHRAVFNQDAAGAGPRPPPRSQSRRPLPRGPEETLLCTPLPRPRPPGFPTPSPWFGG